MHRIVFPACFLFLFVSFSTMGQAVVANVPQPISSGYKDSTGYSINPLTPAEQTTTGGTGGGTTGTTTGTTTGSTTGGGTAPPVNPPQQNPTVQLGGIYESNSAVASFTSPDNYDQLTIAINPVQTPALEGDIPATGYGKQGAGCDASQTSSCPTYTNYLQYASITPAAYTQSTSSGYLSAYSPPLLQLNVMPTSQYDITGSPDQQRGYVRFRLDQAEAAQSGAFNPGTVQSVTLLGVQKGDVFNMATYVGIYNANSPYVNHGPDQAQGQTSQQTSNPDFNTADPSYGQDLAVTNGSTWQMKYNVSAVQGTGTTYPGNCPATTYGPDQNGCSDNIPAMSRWGTFNDPNPVGNAGGSCNISAICQYNYLTGQSAVVKHATYVRGCPTC